MQQLGKKGKPVSRLSRCSAVLGSPFLFLLLLLLLYCESRPELTFLPVFFGFVVSHARALPSSEAIWEETRAGDGSGLLFLSFFNEAAGFSWADLAWDGR